MSKSQSHRRANRRTKAPIKYDPADLSNVVACLGEIKNIMLMMIAEIERIENKPQEESISQGENISQEESNLQNED